MTERELIVEMEIRTKDDIIQLLKSHGIGQIVTVKYQPYSEKKYEIREYVEAKRVVFKDKWIDPNIYDKQIGWICEYLGI